MYWGGTEQTDQDGKKFIHLYNISIISKTEIKEIDKNIYAISDNEKGQYKVVSTAQGKAIGRCVYLGRKYGGKDFFDRVCGYSMVEPKSPGMTVAISFYEKKPD